MSGDRRLPLYIGLVIGFCVLFLIGASLTGASPDRFFYVVLLFAICASPMLTATKPNDAFAVLGVGMAMYFVEFGLFDTVSACLPSASQTHQTRRDGALSAAQLLIIVAAILKVLGFHAGARLYRPSASGRPRTDWPRTDWPRRILAPAGLALWIIGAGTTIYQDLIAQIDSSNLAVTRGFERLGPWLTAILIFADKYLGPLGIVVLSYWWAVYRTRAAALLLGGIIILQFAVGWVVDTKEVAISAPVIILLTHFMVRGKVRWSWIAVTAVALLLVFPVLTAKRVITREAMQLSKVQALPYTAEIFWRSIQEAGSVREGKYEQSSQSLIERLNDKAAIEQFVAHVGIDKPYEHGTTLEQLLYTFVPRILWSDKPSQNSAQLFNREFHISEDPDTYISPTHIGELYWNFGYPGLIFGAALMGMLMGYTCARWDLSRGASLTCVLVIITSIYNVALRDGGQIELDYVVWLRTLLLIWLLDRVLARPVPARVTTMDPTLVTGPLMRPPPTRFLNLMR